LFSTLGDPSLGEQVGFALLSGFGIGNTLQPSLIAVQAGVKRKNMAIVTSFRNFARNLGGTLGLAISGTIINNAIRTGLTPHGLSKPAIQLLINSPELFSEAYGEQRTNDLRIELTSAYRKGFRAIFIVSAVLNALAFVAAWFMIEQIDLKRDDDAQLKEEGRKRDARKCGSANTTG
jgi:predicted MFS family arabinose efflux permease